MRKAPAPAPFASSERLLPSVRVHVVGAGPVGLLLTALLQSLEGFSVRLYEKRREYTRTRMVRTRPPASSRWPTTPPPSSPSR